jgi:hypothetical protein
MVLLLAHTAIQAQGLEELKKAIDDTSWKVQAIHHYPASIKDGECHNVEVTSITVVEDNIKIIEEWSNWAGKKAKTTLSGKIVSGRVSGTWESDYSKGVWKYDFSNHRGEWNKTSGMFDKFSTFQILELTTTKDARDGFFKCQ